MASYIDFALVLLEHFGSLEEFNRLIVRYRTEGIDTVDERLAKLCELVRGNLDMYINLRDCICAAVCNEPGSVAGKKLFAENVITTTDNLQLISSGDEFATVFLEHFDSLKEFNGLIIRYRTKGIYEVDQRLVELCGKIPSDHAFRPQLGLLIMEAITEDPSNYYEKSWFAVTLAELAPGNTILPKNQINRQGVYDYISKQL